MVAIFRQSAGYVFNVQIFQKFEFVNIDFDNLSLELGSFTCFFWYFCYFVCNIFSWWNWLRVLSFADKSCTAFFEKLLINFLLSIRNSRGHSCKWFQSRCNTKWGEKVSNLTSVWTNFWFWGYEIFSRYGYLALFSMFRFSKSILCSNCSYLQFGYLNR